ncbi:YybH family protein [Enterobacter kobei]|uniref:YybH family protein n=1 Tax=Enterobacter kobei TaxID=208224 RepID=UPI0039C9C572
MHPIEEQIHKADRAIEAEDFKTLASIYTEDAILVVKPGMSANGQAQIVKAFSAIAEYFQHSLQVRQAGMTVLEAGDTALVLAKTIVSACNLPETERKATYVFKRVNSGEWLCAIDNSYGHELVDSADV